MLIGRVSELTGASRKAIRHYESIGLITPPVEKATTVFIMIMMSWSSR